MDATPKINGSGKSNGRALAPGASSTKKANAAQLLKIAPVDDTVELTPSEISPSSADDEPRLRIAPKREIDAELSKIDAEIIAGKYLTTERIEGTSESLFDTLG